MSEGREEGKKVEGLKGFFPRFLGFDKGKCHFEKNNPKSNSQPTVD